MLLLRKVSFGWIKHTNTKFIKTNQKIIYFLTFRPVRDYAAGTEYKPIPPVSCFLFSLPSKIQFVINNNQRPPKLLHIWCSPNTNKAMTVKIHQLKLILTYTELQLQLQVWLNEQIGHLQSHVLNKH